MRYNEHWFEKMIDLFEAVTFPSLVRQSSAEFIWLIVVDANIPPKARQRLQGLLSSFPNHHLVSIDVTQLQRLRQGCLIGLGSLSGLHPGICFLDDPLTILLRP